MNDLTVLHDRGRRRLAIIVIATVLGLLIGVLIIALASAGTQILPKGFLDFGYGPDVKDPTAEKPESKLWWNDGFWWGVLYNQAGGAFHIYRLNWGTQEWEDTGVAVDDREGTKADALWDATANKLYIVSHIYKDHGTRTSNPANCGRIYRYTYDATAQTYTLDPGFDVFGVNVNENETETLVIAKDSTGKLWVTFVSRPQGGGDYQVFVNTSSDDGLTWGTFFTVPYTQAIVTDDDISSIVAFKDGADSNKDKIGVMWSNQITTPVLASDLFFATHPDASEIDSGWALEPVTSLPNGAEDHINLKTMRYGEADRVFAIVKTDIPKPTSTDPVIGLVARDTYGVYSWHAFSGGTSKKDTRPIILIDETANKIYGFVSNEEAGDKICVKELAITEPLSSMGDFGNLASCGSSFIEDTAIYTEINNATSTKQNVNSTTGLVVLASDDIYTTTKITKDYVHNVMGDPAPVVTARGPAPGATTVPLTSVVTATFSLPQPEPCFEGSPCVGMNDATINETTVTVSNGGSVLGTVGYYTNTRTMTFIPTGGLMANTIYNVSLGSGIQSSSGKALYGAPEQWSFTTEGVKVQFGLPAYSVVENGVNATITVTLNAPSSQVVTVDYATSNGTATAGVDYTATSGTLTIPAGEPAEGTISVPIIDDATIEGDEMVNLTLSTPSANAEIGVQSTAVLTIVDDETPPTVQFKQASFSAGEGAGTATIEVTLNHTSVETITVDYATSNGTATAVSDYTAQSNTLTFAPGDTSKTFQVPIIQDSLDEADETVNLALSNVSTNASLGTPSNAVLTILDDDNPVQVKFDSSTYTVAESAGSKQITVQLSAAAGKEVKINYTTSDGSAEAGLDYTTNFGTLTFAPGETSKTFSVAVMVDGIAESDETVNLTLGTPVNASLGTPFSAVLTITNDDMYNVYMPVMMKNK